VPIFPLAEYVRAEVAFVYDTIDMLSQSRGGVVGLVRRERTTRAGPTQFTTQEGLTVEMPSSEVAMQLSLAWTDVIAGNVDQLLVTLDAAAEQQHDQLTRYILDSLETVTHATGNQIDASGKSHFEYMYEMFASLALTFEPDGSISPGYTWVMHPDMVEKMRQKEAAMTESERAQLEALIERKRQEYFANRRTRRLS
jgi:hypothetical protein